MVYRLSASGRLLQLQAHETKHHRSSPVTVTTVCMRANTNACMQSGMQTPDRRQTVVNSCGDKKEESESCGFV